jgi:hypothetical protein
MVFATGTLEIVAWVAVALVLLFVAGGVLGKTASSHTAREFDDDGHRQGDMVDRQFRPPPDQGGLL